MKVKNNITCVICESNCESLGFNFKNSVTSDNRFIKKDISYSYCKSCDYIFVDYDKRVNLEKFYKDDYDFLLDNNEVEPAIDGVKYSEYLVSFFSPYISDTNTKNIIDIGSGKGNLLESFYTKFKQLNYFAVEPSHAFFKLNKKEFIKEKYYGFFNENIFDNVKFDYITLVEVLEHVPDPKSFLLSITKVMNEDALLLIEVPNFANHKCDLLTIDHFSLFTENNLTNLLNLCGFKIVKKNISNRVPMQFIVKLEKNIDIDNSINMSMESLLIYEKAITYVSKVINDAIKLNNQPIAVYGQNILLDYLIGNNYLDISNIRCIVNDNIHYQGKKKWNSKIDVVSFENFQKNYNLYNILLAMNDCYHDKIIMKLKNKNVFGVLI